MKTLCWNKPEYIRKNPTSKLVPSTKVDIKEQGQYPDGGERKQKIVETRLTNKLDGIVHLRSNMFEHRRWFNLADYVEGGYQNLPRQEWSMIDYDYLRSAAKEYYLHLILFLTRSLDASVNYYFATFITSESNFEMETSKMMSQLIEDITEDDLKEMTNLDTDTIRNTYINNKTEFENLNLLLPKIRGAVQALEFAARRR